MGPSHNIFTRNRNEDECGFAMKLMKNTINPNKLKYNYETCKKLHQSMLLFCFRIESKQVDNYI